MTLKTRNQFIKTFLFASLAIVALNLITFLFALKFGTILTPPDFRIPAFLSHIPFAKPSFIALMISFAVIILYVPFCFFLLIRYFENTQTSEIIFFTGFLFACLAETARFVTICLGLWQSFSNILIFMGNVVLFGRTLAPLSFLCAALLSETVQRQDIERNYIIMTTVSVVFAAVIPMNTARISSTGLVTEGFMSLINIMRFLLLATTVISFFIQGIKKNSSEHKILALSAFITLLGYSMLVSCDSFFFLISGTLALLAGSYRYLLCLHKMYMWS
ncbi:MAG: hypothetical protein IJ530_09530 [Treponema sp.]|uniref:hypothetical protein n=1 Tax=Treponema sp. TaxID=166 RepID=UPI0025DFC3A6|nr:hypothetical protein [Treponema sp.]MBQ8679990.1 hypothetical protein [Treponema sp.]